MSDCLWGRRLRFFDVFLSSKRVEYFLRNCQIEAPCWWFRMCCTLSWQFRGCGFLYFEQMIPKQTAPCVMPKSSVEHMRQTVVISNNSECENILPNDEPKSVFLQLAPGVLNSVATWYDPEPSFHGMLLPGSNCPLFFKAKFYLSFRSPSTAQDTSWFCLVLFGNGSKGGFMFSVSHILVRSN